jgi:ATP-dependent DNA ligase
VIPQDVLMDLPLMPPVSPMLAKSESDVPEGDYLYEPKWDAHGAPAQPTSDC